MDYTINRKLEVINNGVKEKRKALTEHLLKSQARKNEYRIVKGDTSLNSNNVVSSSVKLKSVGRDFERFAKASLNQSDDVGSKTITATYDVGKTVVTATKTFNAVTNKVSKGSVKVVDGSINIAGKTYTVAKNIYNGYKSGTLKGTLNIYKNMIFNKVANSIKYSKPVYSTRNFINSTKGLYLKSSYRLSKSVTFIKGVKNGTIKVTPRMAGSYAWKGAKSVTRGTWNVSKTTVKSVSKYAKSKPVTSIANGLQSGLKSIGRNGNDIGVQAMATSTDVAKYSFKALKTGRQAINKTAKATDKTAKGVYKTAKGVYKTAKGTYRFVKDVRKIGLKKTSKIWYNAHLKGAGKKAVEKVGDAILKALGSFLKNPAVLGALALAICVVFLSSTVVIVASSTVGGVIEFFEELAEGLQEAIDTVIDAITDFLNDCVDWLKSLFGVDDDEVKIEVDVDIGDSMSICDYLLGTVQVYKAEFALKLDERRKELIDDEGYHDVLFYNNVGGEMFVHDYHDVDQGLMADKEYVKAELPVWKAIIFGTIGTDFTGKQANNIAKECFEALTEKTEEPYVDVNGDGVGDYSYCDGTSSVEEGANQVVVKVNGAWLYGLDMAETDRCYNLSEELYHDTSVTDEGVAIGCCKIHYSCGGHNKYTCLGHSTKCWEGESDNFGSCSNHSTNTIYCEEENEDECSNLVDTLAYCWNGYSEVRKDCDNYSVTVVDDKNYYVCQGHDLEFCTEENIGECDNLVNATVYCWNGYGNVSMPATTNCSDYDTVNISGSTVYVCNGHEDMVCNGHTPQKCNGHNKYTCLGHSTKCWEGESDNFGSCSNYSTRYFECWTGKRLYPNENCSNNVSELLCRGYNLCYGHRLMKFTFGSNGFDELVASEFTDRIDELNAKDNLTEEERQELSQLEMYYEYALGCWNNSDPVADEWYENQP